MSWQHWGRNVQTVGHFFCTTLYMTVHPATSDPAMLILADGDSGAEYRVAPKNCRILAPPPSHISGCHPFGPPRRSLFQPSPLPFRSACAILTPPGMLVPRASTVLAITESRTPVMQPICCATSTTSAVSAARNAREQTNDGQPRQYAGGIS